MTYRPIDIAKKINVSTSLLRFYEKQQLFPAPKRTDAGYRIYTEESFFYLQAVRTATIAYNYKKTREVMALIQNKQFIDVFWLLNEEEVQLHNRKRLSEQTLALLHEEEWTELTQMPKQGWITIGEAAKRLSLTETTIRHWTKEHLLEVPRDPESNYRMFDTASLKQLLIIRMIRASTWSLEKVKEILNHFTAETPEEMIQLAEHSLQVLNQQLTRQFIAKKYIYQLIHHLSPDFFQDFPGIDYYYDLF